MNPYEDPQPIATPAEYRLALLEARNRMTDNHLAMLRLHSAAPEQAISAEQLAEALDLPFHGAATRQYGAFAKWIADALGYAPDCQASGTPRWWRAISYSRPEQPERKDGSFQWVMRPELLEALRMMRWVT